MLEGLTVPQKEPICRMMAAATSTFDKNDLKIFVDAINNPLWSAKKLAAEITRRGFVVSQKQILTHRQGGCPCAK